MSLESPGKWGAEDEDGVQLETSRLAARGDLSTSETQARRPEIQELKVIFSCIRPVSRKNRKKGRN